MIWGRLSDDFWNRLLIWNPLDPCDIWNAFHFQNCFSYSFFSYCFLLLFFLFFFFLFFFSLFFFFSYFFPVFLNFCYSFSIFAIIFQFFLFFFFQLLHFNEKIPKGMGLLFSENSNLFRENSSLSGKKPKQ